VAERCDELSSCHPAAFVGAAAASFRAAFTVLGLVLAALGGAAVARLGTGTADGGGYCRAAAHVPGADPAQFGAVAAGADAAGHINVADAGIAAMFALLGAREARLDAASELLTDHVGLQSSELV
jgi:hypothetical protein